MFQHLWYHRELSAVRVHAISLYSLVSSDELLLEIKQRSLPQGNCLVTGRPFMMSWNGRLLNNRSVRHWTRYWTARRGNMVTSRPSYQNRMPKFRLSQQPIWKSEVQTAVWRWVRHADRRFLVPRTNFHPTVLPFLAIASCGRKTTFFQYIRKHRIPLDSLALSLWIYKMTIVE